MDSKLVVTLDKKYHTLLERYGINTDLRKAHFWGQLYHESGCKPIQENLNYSKEGLLRTFPKYFTVDTIDKNKKIIFGTASIYAHNKVAIANKVYGNRMGNGDEKSGDGWKYSGKGFIQITGKDNYTALTKGTNIDFINHPELLLIEANALISALWYWKRIKANELADKDNVKAITKLINGGTIGLEERINNVEALKEVFKTE